MELVELSPYIVAILFFAIAFLYSSVGLGGGSSYTALMALLGFNALAIPMVSLVLNVLVTSIGSFNFIRFRHARFKLILPFLVSSIPFAYIGGALQLPKTVFYWILLLSLLFVALRIYVLPQASIKLNLGYRQKIMLSLALGSVLGFIAGVAGIGGGIYLVPLIIILGLGSAKEAAACGAIFIFLNSLSGLASRLQYNSIDLIPYLPIIVGVLAGGAIGSFVGSSRFSPRTMERVLGLVVLVAIVFLLKKLITPALDTN